MTDILIQDNGLAHSDGDLYLVRDVEEVKQHIKTALYTFSREWSLDPDKGINYPRGIRNTDLLETEIRKQIIGVDGVLSLDNFSLKFDRDNLNIQITAAISTVYGNIDLNEQVSNYL